MSYFAHESAIWAGLGNDSSVSWGVSWGSSELRPGIIQRLITQLSRGACSVSAGICPRGLLELPHSKLGSKNKHPRGEGRSCVCFVTWPQKSYNITSVIMVGPHILERKQAPYFNEGPQPDIFLHIRDGRSYYIHLRDCNMLPRVLPLRTLASKASSKHLPL